MSLNGLSNTFIPYTLNGIQDLTIQSSTAETLQLLSLNPNKVVVSDSNNFLVSSSTNSTEIDYLVGSTSNIQNQLNSKASTSYLDTNFLNKTTATEQTITAASTFNSTVTAAGYYTDTAGYNFARPNASYNAWGITRIANGGQIRDLQFKDDTANVDCLLLSNTGQTVYVGLTCDYGTGNKVPIWNADKKLVSSGVDSIKITYLDNVSSDIQTQLNGKLSLSGGVMNGNISMGFNNISSLYTPVNANDVVNKGYVDGAISGAGSLYLLKTGGIMTGDIVLNGNKVTSTASPTTDDTLTRKGYVDTQDALRLALTGGTLSGTVLNSAGDFHPYRGGDTNRGCILFANNQDGASYSNYNGGLASWYGIGFKSTLDSITRFMFDTRSGDSSQVGSITCAGLTSSTAITVDAGVNVGTRLLGTPDGSPGNFWMGLRGTGTEVERLAISINGATTTGIVSYVSIAKLLYLSAYTANRALYLDGSQAVQASSTTGTELGYLSGVTSGLQGQIDAKAPYTYVDSQNNAQNTVIATKADTTYVDSQNNAQNTVIATKADTTYVDSQNNSQNTVIATKADTTYVNTQDGLRVLKSGDTVTGTLGLSSSNVVEWGVGVTKEGNAGKIGYQTFSAGCLDVVGAGIGGVTRKVRIYDSMGIAQTPTDTFNVNGVSGFAGEVNIGVSGNTVPNLKFSNNLNHITGNAAEAYLFNGQNGYIAVGRNTTRSATEANLHIGTAGTDASIESIASNGSVYLPLSYYASRHYFTGGNVGIKTSDPQGDLHVQLTGAVNDYWGKFIVKTTSFWGDGCSTRSETAGLQYATVFPMMFLTPHIVSDSDGWAHIRMGRSGGVSTGRWWEVSNRADGFFQIGAERSGQFIINPNGNVGIGADPAYKLDVTGDIRSSGSLLFGNTGVYEAGCIFSNTDWGCLLRAKQNAPAQAHFNWRTSDGTDLMRISPSGVMNFYGGATPYAVPGGLSTTAGALVIGGNSINYNDGWNTGLLMECADTTGITVHDAGEKLASFMYYGTNNRFLMGKDAGSGWGTTPIDIQGDLYLTGTQIAPATTSVDYQLSRDPFTDKCIWTPKKYVSIYDTLNVPKYVNWNGVQVFNCLYLNVASNILFQGFFTFFTDAVGQRYAYARLYHAASNTYYYPEATKFFNITNNHEVVPINQFFYNLPAGNYDLYMFGGSNVLVDGNDRAVFSAIVFS